MADTAQFWIDRLRLSPHPEGGYFREIYRSDEIIHKKNLPDRYSGFRNFSSSIYFLLESNEFSAFHRIKSDEIWHFYSGSALSIISINVHGQLLEQRLGNPTEEGDVLQLTIPRGSWFMAKVNAVASFSLVGCTVAPGFDFDDFELGKKAELTRKFPHLEKLFQDYCIR
ncbi:MAG: cupin domain-containing protein [Bacteroidetes bacterium]|nr:cupin domain-containing protein [Bacteroidota bacterium]